MNWELIDIDNQRTRWIKLVEFEFDQGYSRILGISEKGKWIDQKVWKESKKLHSIEKDGNFYPILSYLEIERSQLEKEVLKASTENKGMIKTIDPFPFRDFIKYGLQTTSHWKNKALDWLEEDDIDLELKKILEKYLLDKENSQRNRQRVLKMIKRIEKGL